MLVALIFTLKDVPGRALGVIDNLLPLVERACSLALINSSHIA